MTLRSATACLLVLAVALPVAACAQFTEKNDPANLAGERVSAPDPADTLPLNHGTLALEQLLRKLRTRASFMLIVAHPDDEDNGMLTYLSRGKGARVATLTLNRGEGGQNLMSADFGDALGLIRTQELLLSDRYMGVDQFFGTEVDFGFSKTKEEAFSKWTHERVLYDAVRAIRLYRPLVIASVFIGEPSDGHGQHQVAGEIAQEAFKAAGDPNVFPDQISNGLLPWQPLKVYARSPFGRIDEKGMYDYATNRYVPARFENYVTGKVTTTVPKANVVVPEGDTDPLLDGESYAQFGREGRSLQRSQIGGGSGGRGQRGGRVDVSYHRYGSMLHQPDGDDSGLESGFFDGIDTSLPGICSLAPEIPGDSRRSLEEVDSRLAKAQQEFDPTNPERIAPLLGEALKDLDGFIESVSAIKDLPSSERFDLLHELRIKRVQLNDALVLALGISAKAKVFGPTAGDVVLSQHPVLSAELDISMKTHVPTQLRGLTFTAPNERISLDCGMKPLPTAITEGANCSLSHPLKPGLVPTRPYFSRKGIEQPFYDIATPELRNAPATPAPFLVHVRFDSEGVPLDVDAIVTKQSSDNRTEPVVIVPPISISVVSGVGIVTPKERSFNVAAEVRSSTASPISGNVTLRMPDHKAADGGPQNFSFQKVNQEAQFAFAVPASAIPGHTVRLSATATQDRQTYAEGFRAVGYHGLTPTNYYTPATYKAVPVDVHTAPSLNIAYLPGTGDDVPAGLEQLGIHARLITIADIAAGKLSQYDAIILGVRAYAAHPELAGKGSAPLIDYARNGGVVIAQYNNALYGKDEAPFPIAVAASSGDHAHDVVDETAPVTILAPDSPILTWPNHITAADFDGWVEERGHSFAATWATEYKPLLSTHDPGQDPQEGGLLVAHVGKGLYAYLGLALYRQLPEGVPGAYRLLANLVSAGKNPGLK